MYSNILHKSIFDNGPGPALRIAYYRFVLQQAQCFLAGGGRGKQSYRSGGSTLGALPQTPLEELTALSHTLYLYLRGPTSNVGGVAQW